MTLQDFADVMTLVNAETIITARRGPGPGDTYRIAMGPFPTRIRYVEPGEILLDVVVGFVRSGADIFGAMERVPFPQPSVAWTLQPESLVTITYPADPATFTPDQAVGICAAGAMFGATLARELLPDMTPKWRQRLAKSGIDGAEAGDPRNLLQQAEILEWSEWPK